MIRGVIFDFDNTLYNYNRANSDALAAIFELIYQENKEKTISVENIAKVYQTINKQVKESNNSAIKFNKTIYIKKILEFFHIPYTSFDKYYTIYQTVFSRSFILYDGVVECLKYLKVQNIKIAILSNNIFIQQYQKLQESNILQYIDVIQTSDECGEEKPHISMFLQVSHKLHIPFHQLVYVGDDYNADILPALELSILPFHFITDLFDLEKIKCIQSKTHDSVNNNNKNTNSQYIITNNFKNQIVPFFQHLIEGSKDLEFLSIFFGQSVWNVQGPGGNISVKINDNQFMLIKSSGQLLGNVCSKTGNGFCLTNTETCKKIYGDGVPSMETPFHSFMKKYTVHIHFTLTNIFLCSAHNSMEEILNKNGRFRYPYKIIEYVPPGSILSRTIRENYNNDTNIYFLRNHGVIITGETVNEILEIYEYMFHYFSDAVLGLGKRPVTGTITELNKEKQWTCFMLNIFLYNKYQVCKIIQSTNYDSDIIQNIKYCFPDLAVFIQKVIVLADDVSLVVCLDNNDYVMTDEVRTPNDVNIIIYKSNAYLVADTINKMCALREMIDEYIRLYHNTPTELEPIMDINYLQNMEEEKIRLKR